MAHYLTESEAIALHEKLEKVECLACIFELMAYADMPIYKPATGALIAYEAIYHDGASEFETGILLDACKAIEKIGITDMHNIYSIVTGQFFTKAFTCPIKLFLADCDYDTFSIWYVIAKKNS